VIGGGYAAGLSVGRITDEVLKARFSSFADYRPRRRLGLFDTEVMVRNSEAIVGPILIEQLPRRFGAVAFDIRRRRPVLLTSGSLATAVRASTAIPGLFPPVAIGSDLLIDGVMADNVPVAAAQRLGAGKILAVDVGPSRSDGRFAAATRWARGSLGGGMGSATVPTLLVRPSTKSFTRWSHTDVPDLIACGRHAAEVAFDDILTFLAESSRSQPLSNLCHNQNEATHVW
jgi:NTE family protein